MICDSCHKQPATVFVKTIVNNQVTQAAFCVSCAQGASPVAVPADALLDLLSARRPRAQVSRCPGCRTSFADFREAGRFGCPHCYEHFAPLIKPLIPRVHAGATLHRGKAPRHAA